MSGGLFDAFEDVDDGFGVVAFGADEGGVDIIAVTGEFAAEEGLGLLGADYDEALDVGFDGAVDVVRLRMRTDSADSGRYRCDMPRLWGDAQVAQPARCRVLAALRSLCGDCLLRLVRSARRCVG